MKLENVSLSLSYDDLLLIPQKSNVTPRETELKVHLAHGIDLNLPFVSSAMDTVSEAPLAIALASCGGLAFIHKNMSIENEAKQVEEVKKAQPIDYSKDGLFPSLDSKGRLLVGAAVGVASDMEERVEALVKANVDIIALDSAHGHSENILLAIKKIKSRWPSLPLVGGNIVTKEAAEDLIEAGADVVKVGIGPGSICTTRVVSGVGMPQASAVDEVVTYCEKKGITVIADGGIRYSGDIVKALALGAKAVMLGSLFAEAEEAPGTRVEIKGVAYKSYVGMGSLTAMGRGSADRYFQKNGEKANKLVPEGIEALVKIKGPLCQIVYQLAGGLRSGMGYCGAKDLDTLHKKAKFTRISLAGLKESHPHDVLMEKESPNYDKIPE